MAFSLGSFFGTLFDISYGALFLKKLKHKIYFFLNSFYLAYVLLAYLLVLFFKKFSTFTVAENDINLSICAGTCDASCDGSSDDGGDISTDAGDSQQPKK